MAAVGGATSKSTPGPSHSTQSSSPSSQSNGASRSDKSQQPQNQKNNKDSFESGESKDKKQKVNLTGEDTSAPAARQEVSQSAGTDPAVKREDKGQLDKNTRWENKFEAGSTDASARASGEVGKDGVKGEVNAQASATAFKDQGKIEHKTEIPGSDVSLNNTVSGEVKAEAEAHFNAEGHASPQDGVGGSVEAGASAALSGELKGKSELNIKGENGEAENLASVEAGVQGHVGPEVGIKAGGGYQDGELTAELGLDLSPIVGGGVDVKVGVNADNIVENGGKIADEIARGAGALGDQIQKGLGETVSGIQRFFGGVSIFG
ncbi:MAG TPA: hypothetical protein VFB81_11700 [Myxococcales bacterium]|nr:hypothetical protein [Myxococcales bacterium]